MRMRREDMPKQFLPLGEKPVMIHTMEQFFVNARIDKIIVVAPDAWRQYTQDLITQYNSMGKEVSVIIGGANKTESIDIIVKYIDEKWGVSGEDMLITHDAIRPFVTQRIIDENINAAMSKGAVNTVITTNDTILTSKDGHTVGSIPPKNMMFAQQTPQTYMLQKLQAAFTQAAEKHIPLREESELARLYTQLGNEMYFVMGEYSNMKIINPYDLEVANALLKEKKHD